MSTQNFMSYGDAETIFTDVQAKKFSTGNVSTIQSTLTASKAYNQNDPFIYNGQLYKADSAIAQGGAITIGTNASATTIEELINLHSSSGSGGHTILNGLGSAMNQRGKLQFSGFIVDDDPVNDKTVVSPEWVQHTLTKTGTSSGVDTFSKSGLTIGASTMISKPWCDKANVRYLEMTTSGSGSNCSITVKYNSSDSVGTVAVFLKG